MIKLASKGKANDGSNSFIHQSPNIANLKPISNDINNKVETSDFYHVHLQISKVDEYLNNTEGEVAFANIMDGDLDSGIGPSQQRIQGTNTFGGGEVHFNYFSRSLSLNFY